MQNEKEEVTKCKPYCTECGSEDVTFNAGVSWNEEEQRFEYTVIYDEGHHCNSCDSIDSIEWKYY